MAKVTNSDKQQVIDWTKFWAGKLSLDRFTIDVKFHRKCDPNEGDTTTFADVGYHYAGLEAIINIWLPFWSLSITQREKVCLHELAHILLPSATETEICAITEIIWRMANPSITPMETT
jgi:hypothetical protein